MTVKQKNIRDYIIGFCVICILIVTLVIKWDSSKFMDGEEESVEAITVVELEGNTITDMEITDIKKVTYTLKDKEPITFEKKSDTWVLSEDEEFPLSVDSFEEQFLQKYVDGKVYNVIEDYSSLADYGIDDPQVTLEVIDKDGNVRTYLVGCYNGVIDSYYMYHKEADKLYVASSDFLYICREDIYDFAGIDNFPSFSTDSLEKLVMSNELKKVELVYMADGYESDPFSSSTWFILSPFNFYRACDTQDVTDNFEELFTGLGFSRKADYYATDEELESYGLINSKRYYEIVYRFDEEDDYEYNKITVKVVFGNYNEDVDGYYARILLTQGLTVNEEISRSINYIARDVADKILNLDPIDYIYPFVLYVPMKEFAGGGLTVTKNDGTVLEVEYEATYTEGIARPSNESIVLNGKEADLEAFKEFYYQLTKVYVNRPIYTSDEIITDEPVYVISYDRIENDDYYGDAVVEYRVYDSTYYQVTINGYVDCLVVRRDVDKAVAMLEELNN